MARALLNVPKTATRGDVIEIKALVAHPMETGFRSGPQGSLLPRDIVHRVLATFNGAEVFSADLHPAVAANPFVSFTMRAEESGTLVVRWIGDNGFAQAESATLTVT